MGAGLRMNIGSTWGPQVWKDTTGSAPSSVLVNTANAAAKKCERNRKRKTTNKSKENRKRSKYAHTDKSVEARQAYSRHDGGREPDDRCH